MKHVWRTYHHNDWQVRDDCINCGVTRRRPAESKVWTYADNHNRLCTPATQIDMSPAEAALAVRGDER